MCLKVTVSGKVQTVTHACGYKYLHKCTRIYNLGKLDKHYKTLPGDSRLKIGRGHGPDWYELVPSILTVHRSRLHSLVTRLPG